MILKSKYEVPAISILIRTVLLLILKSTKLQIYYNYSNKNNSFVPQMSLGTKSPRSHLSMEVNHFQSHFTSSLK